MACSINDYTQQTGKDTWDEISSAFKGLGAGIGDTILALYHMPDDVAGYIGGRDRYLGERRDVTLYLDDWPRGVEMLNPFSARHPIYRTADTACSFVFGVADLMLGHTPNWLFNEQLGLGFKYFQPSPQSWREIGADYSMAGGILATPFVKAKLMPKSAQAPLVMRNAGKAEIEPAKPPLGPDPAYLNPADLIENIEKESPRFNSYLSEAIRRAEAGENTGFLALAILISGRSRISFTPTHLKSLIRSARKSSALLHIINFLTVESDSALRNFTADRNPPAPFTRVEVLNHMLRMAAEGEDVWPQFDAFVRMYAAGDSLPAISSDLSNLQAKPSVKLGREIVDKLYPGKKNHGGHR